MLAGTTGLEPATSCVTGNSTLSTPFILSLIFHTLPLIRGFCFRSKSNPFNLNSLHFWNTFGTPPVFTLRVALSGPNATAVRLSRLYTLRCHPWALRNSDFVISKRSPLSEKNVTRATSNLPTMPGHSYCAAFPSVAHPRTDSSTPGATESSF